MAKMNISQDNEMQRGMVQSIFSYLPSSHVDFHIRSTRTNYSALVKYWKTGRLKNINSNRILSLVKECLDDFVGSGGAIKGFSVEFSAKTYNIQTPVLDEEGTIFSIIDPLTFFCHECKRAYTFKSRYDYESKAGIEHECCKHSLKQIMFTFPCECGYCGSIWAIKCKKHPGSGVYYDTNNYAFICAECSERIDMRTKCPDCGKVLFPHAALDRSNFIAANTTLIDLLNSDEEHFLSAYKYGNNVIISKWLNKLTSNEYDDIISGREAGNYEDEKKHFDEKFEEYKNMGLDDETASSFSNADMASSGKLSLIGVVNNFIKTILTLAGDSQLSKASCQILEYYRVMRSSNLCTIEEAMSIVSAIKPDIDLKIYDWIKEKLGFSNFVYSGNIPFLLITFGYTRISDAPSDTESSNILTLRAFNSKGSDVSTIYGLKMETEGILFELDKRKIVKWLISNKVIDKLFAPDLHSDSDLNRWFIDNVDMSALTKFSNIDEASHPITAAVYRLMHSISHALIRKAGICGLDISSIGEYLLPNIPAFIIYCKNTGGISIGAFASLFKIHFTEWLVNAYNDIDNCISDPICIERDKACNGCLLLPNTSCQRQNKDLDRSLLCGFTDFANNKKTFGFWNY